MVHVYLSEKVILHFIEILVVKKCILVIVNQNAHYFVPERTSGDPITSCLECNFQEKTRLVVRPIETN